jgi:hypothetical protein
MIKAELEEWIQRYDHSGVHGGQVMEAPLTGVPS